MLNKKGFSGLEAAIVLIAFVIVAAVFSYIVLNLGFFTAHKSKEVVHRGTDQASSSLSLIGSVIGHGNTATQRLTNVTIYLETSAGTGTIDLARDKTIIAYTYPDEGIHQSNIYIADDQLTFVGENNGDKLLDVGEKAKFVLGRPGAAISVKPNTEFTIEVKPPNGAPLGITRKAPPAIKRVMDLH
jgi:flagellin FlaB